MMGLLATCGSSRTLLGCAKPKNPIAACGSSPGFIFPPAYESKLSTQWKK